MLIEPSSLNTRSGTLLGKIHTYAQETHNLVKDIEYIYKNTNNK